VPGTVLSGEIVEATRRENAFVKWAWVASVSEPPAILTVIAVDVVAVAAVGAVAALVGALGSEAGKHRASGPSPGIHVRIIRLASEEPS
jgi:hypothetical protein